jgi:hypothetical protein
MEAVEHESVPQALTSSGGCRSMRVAIFLVCLKRGTMSKRTSEGQAREMERIHAEALRRSREHLLPHLLEHPDTPEPAEGRRNCLPLLAPREREDRCYYCFATKKELGIESATGLTQCIDCAGDAYTKRLELSRRLGQRLNDGYLL